LERKGIYFHRLAIQALSAGPILALNIKPFSDEEVNFIAFDSEDIEKKNTIEPNGIRISNVYDTNRFWTLNADLLPEKIGECHSSKYVSIVSTDTKESSCTIFMRPVKPDSYNNITIRQWYNSQSMEMPEYLYAIQDTMLDEYFMEIYVFRGEFTHELCKNVVGKDKALLGSYFNQDVEGLVISTDYKDAFGDAADALACLASDSNSNFVASYTGCMIPYFKDANGNYISLDIKFNMDNHKHKMLMNHTDFICKGIFR
jgi:hypothetical protein